MDARGMSPDDLQQAHQERRRQMDAGDRQGGYQEAIIEADGNSGSTGCAGAQNRRLSRNGDPRRYAATGLYRMEYIGR